MTCCHLLILFILLAIYCKLSDAVAIQLLTGQWSVLEATKPNENYNAVVPGGIYSDLMNNKAIGDVFYGYNDTETRWVAKKNWTYHRQFLVLEETLSHEQVNIVFDGLDTFATVSINGKDVGHSENMFVRYIFDVKSVLKLGNNSIEVRFISPIYQARELAKKQDYLVPPVCPPFTYWGECNANQIRKMQASFSWDWGPALPSMGIWKSVYLEGFNTSTILDLVVDISEAPNDAWRVAISTYLGGKSRQIITGQLVHQLETDISKIQFIQEVQAEIGKGLNEVRTDYSFDIPRGIVKRWWPNGYGDQNLYELTTQFKSGSESRLARKRIGFRKIELIQEPINEGLSFYFKVNDVPIFAKGSNEIPLNILPEKGQDPELILSVLKSVKESNMNMLRVWGGGVYESELFYSVADEYGIMIWQDFMFACAMYPTYPEYLSNVKKEIQHQVKRLSSHPSIVLWAGNNENEAALVQNWYSTSKNFSLYKNDFIKLYVDVIKEEFEKLAPGAIYVTSSPSNGKKTEESGYVSSDPQSQIFGDVHFYNYLTNSLDMNTYPVPRFASEYGYQSLPDVDAWLTVTDSVSDLHPISPFMLHRQHHPLGFTQNSVLIKFQLNINESSPNYAKTFIFYSQIIQAMSIKFETELYRSFMGRLDERGRGNTMGALYWQLNDVWVAPTWSGIDFTGKWKMLQYFAKDFFAPTLLTGYLDIQRQLRIYLVSEVPSLLSSSLNATVVIEVFQWKSFQPLDTITKPVTIQFGKSEEVAMIDTDNYLVEAGCGSLSAAKSNCFFYLTLKIEKLLLAPNNFILINALKNSNLLQTQVDITSIKSINSSNQEFDVTITASGISVFIWLDSHNIRGRFSKNGFMQVTPTQSVRFNADKATTVDELRKTLSVTHLKDVQYV